MKHRSPSMPSAAVDEDGVAANISARLALDVYDTHILLTDFAAGDSLKLLIDSGSDATIDQEKFIKVDEDGTLLYLPTIEHWPVATQFSAGSSITKGLLSTN